MKIPNEILIVAERLGEFREQVVFVGGMVRGLLVSDPAVEGPRPTKDVDLILEVSTAGQFGEMGAKLRRLGFREDTSEDALICRYVLPGADPAGGDLPVDFMPLDARVLGFSNPWYPGAYSAPQLLSSSSGQLRIINAPHFMATKLVSFKGRGEGDYYHHDMEDILVLVDGRPELLNELSIAPDPLRTFVAQELTTLLQLRDFRDCLPGHLAPDAASQGRLPLLLSRLKSIAKLVSQS